MSALGDVFKAAGVAHQQLVEIVALLKDNPMAAMAAVQKLELDETVLQQVMGVVMANPNAIEDLAKELGLSDEDIKAVQDQIKGSMQG